MKEQEYRSKVQECIVKLITEKAYACMASESNSNSYIMSYGAMCRERAMEDAIEIIKKEFGVN